MELSGTLEGKPFTFREQAYRIPCDSSNSKTGFGEPCITVRALQLTNLTTNLLRGVRVTFLKDKVAPGSSYEIGDMTPAKVFVVQAVQNGSGQTVYDDAEFPLSGKVTLTSMATQEGEALSGTLENIDVYPKGKTPLNSEPQVRIASGTFRYVWPALQ